MPQEMVLRTGGAGGGWPEKVKEAFFSLQLFTSGQRSEMHLNLNASADDK